MSLIPLLLLPLIIGVFVYMVVQRGRERARNAPLRAEIAAQRSFATNLDRVAAFKANGFGGGTRGYWIVARGYPKQLIVGTNAFMVSIPYREYVFRGSESSIAISQEPSRMITRDWIIITGRQGTRQVDLAISRSNALPEIWAALAQAGATPGPLPRLV